jgi:hypothetical protein
MEHQDTNPGSVHEAPPATSIAIFAVVVALLFGGMYFFFPGNDRPIASNPSPTVATSPASPVEPTTTGQGGNAK